MQIRLSLAAQNPPSDALGALDGMPFEAEMV